MSDKKVMKIVITQEDGLTTLEEGNLSQEDVAEMLVDAFMLLVGVGKWHVNKTVLNEACDAFRGVAMGKMTAKLALDSLFDTDDTEEYFYSDELRY